MPTRSAPVRGGKGERTRERLLGAAIGELRRTGIAAADVKSIAAAAGVTVGTFYFHFPTKEHVLIELERREEERIAQELTRFFEGSPELPAALTRIVDSLKDLEQRLGSILFKDFLSLHFSSARPSDEVWIDHPVIAVVVEEFRRASDRGVIPPSVAPLYSGLFFLVGLYGLLMTLADDEPLRDHVLKQYEENALNGMRVQRPLRD